MFFIFVLQTTMFSCKRGDFSSAKKMTVLRHLYNHIPQDEWPYLCPVKKCLWYCRARYDFSTHKESKGHLKNMLANMEVVNELQPNPNARDPYAEGWITQYGMPVAVTPFKEKQFP